MPIEAAKAPLDPVATMEHARQALDQGDPEQALATLDEALQAQPALDDLLICKVRMLRQLGRTRQALAACDAGLATAGDPSRMQVEMAQCWLDVPDLQAAIDALHVAVELDPCHGPAWLLLGETWRRLDQPADAQPAYREAIVHLVNDHERAQACFLLGQSLMYTSDIELARAAFQQCLDLVPEHVDARVGLGNSALWMDAEVEAVQHYELALQQVAHPSRLLLLNLASALQNCGRFEEAKRLFEQVLAENPRDHTTRWYACQLDLALCRWPSGWLHFQSRYGSGASPYRPMPFRTWDGTPAPDDTLLLLGDEGIGDEIMNASCIADVQRLFRHVILECEPRLETIFRRSFPGVSVVGTHRDNGTAWLAGLPQPDWQLSVSDLPGYFRRRDEDFPVHTGYLVADQDRVGTWRQRLDAELGAGLKVGISWRGGTAKTRIGVRTLPAHDWKPILSVPGVNFINLQYGDCQAERADLEAQHGVRIHDFPQAHASYDETAALVAGLDLVISVCTAIVHLGGALGRPMWVLTPLSPGWRYTAHRDRMPWYPSTRLFRQKQWGTWGPVCQEVSTELSQLTRFVSAERS